MQYKDLQVNSILNKIVKKDKLFSGDYTLDPYKNCEFGCRYCDSSFEKTVYVKSNALEILDSELKKSKNGTIIVGSVHDPYQKIEKQLGLTRELLKIIQKHNFDCHILTKSNLVTRDMDILSSMKHSQVTISIISLDEDITDVFERNVPNSLERLKTVKKLNENGIKAGVAIIPLLPFITENEIEDILKIAKQNKARYILYKYLELKGDQKNIFFEIIKKFKPNLLEKYEKLYEDSYKPNNKYIANLNDKIEQHKKKYKIKK